MSNKTRRLYVGFTDDLAVRVIQHREKFFPNSFTASYVFDMLVFYETYSSPIRKKYEKKRSRDGVGRKN
jgi:putative endonuclease